MTEGRQEAWNKFYFWKNHLRHFLKMLFFNLELDRQFYFFVFDFLANIVVIR